MRSSTEGSPHDLALHSLGTREWQGTLRPTRPEGKPILVTGSHRSGTTWLANMLALTDGTLLAHEPFNIEPWAYSPGGLAKRWFTYAPGLPQEVALKAFDAVLERRTRKAFLKGEPQHWLPPLRRGRLVVKDPIAALSSEWLAQNYDLEPYRAEIESKPQDIVDQAALLWKCLYSVLFTYLGRNPGWHLRRHEALSADSVGGLRGLYESLDLGWTARVRDGVAEHTRSGNPAAQGHQEQVVSGGAALVAKPGFHLFPKRLVHVLSHGLLVFGIHETREFSRRDRHPTVLARGLGEP